MQELLIPSLIMLHRVGAQGSWGRTNTSCIFPFVVSLGFLHARVGLNISSLIMLHRGGDPQGVRGCGTKWHMIHYNRPETHDMHNGIHMFI